MVNNAKFWLDRDVNAIGDTVPVTIDPGAHLYAGDGSTSSAISWWTRSSAA
ncbi:MAG: hypothetical protein U1F77_04245 [Kiritimatiellia bacterium]